MAQSVPNSQAPGPTPLMLLSGQIVPPSPSTYWGCLHLLPWKRIEVDAMYPFGFLITKKTEISLAKLNSKKT